MKKILFLMILFFISEAYGQSFSFEGKTFGAITESICGDGTGFTTYLYLQFDEKQVKIIEKESPIMGKTYISYKIQRKWLRSGDKILIAKVSDTYSVDNFSFRIEGDKLVGEKRDYLIEFDQVSEYETEILNLFHDEKKKK